MSNIQSLVNIHKTGFQTDATVFREPSIYHIPEIMSKLKNYQRKNLWFERVMAITATVNLVLVFFDLSYVPWRDFYFRRLPEITRLYDPVKGIEPHRDTKKYLEAVAGLEKQVTQTGLSLTSSQS